MTVDQYAICPCGTGKKIKFCKCKDSVGELDKVMTMVDGGQIVPALDRLANILTEHPDAAWALAVRGRLLMDLREYDSLAENADRFIRLQPSNPLALTQRAAAKVFAMDIAAATESLLEALNESGRDVDSFVMDVATIVAMVLGQTGNLLSARIYSMLSAYTQGYENTDALSFIGQLDTNPAVNHRLKRVPNMIERPADAEWGERFDEALGLLNNNKVLLAASKFDSLRRTASGEPSVLSGLLLCAIWNGDMDQQYDFLVQLSACESLDFEERVGFRALAALINPIKDVSVSMVQLVGEVENVDEAEMALIAHDHFLQLPAEATKQFVASEEDVPPRSVFRLGDRPVNEKPESLPDADAVPVSKAVVLVYGKQTDRDARVEAMEVAAIDADWVKEQLGTAIEGVSLEQSDSSPMPLLEACEVRPALDIRAGSMLEIQSLIGDFAELHLAETAAKLPLGILGGKSLVEASGDESLALERTAVVRVLASYESIGSREMVMEKIHSASGIEGLPVLKLDSNSLEEGVPNEDLSRVDTSELKGEDLVYVMSRCQSLGMRALGSRVARQVLDADLPPEKNRLRLQTYAYLLSTASSSEDALKIVDEAIAFAKANEFKFANFLMAKLEIHLAARDDEGFKATIYEIDSNYRTDPEVMATLQQFLMRIGLIRPDGSLRADTGGPAGGQPAAPSAPAAQSGLWTPDSGAPPAAGSGGGGTSESGGGGGKLWVPGMD